MDNKHSAELEGERKRWEVPLESSGCLQVAFANGNNRSVLMLPDDTDSAKGCKEDQNEQ